MLQLKEGNPRFLYSGSGEAYTNPFFLFSRLESPRQKKLLWRNFSYSYYRIGARYYDPDLAMYTSPDPGRQFHSLYSYTGNGLNPINGIDPDGNEFNTLGNAVYTIAESNNFYNNPIVKRDLTWAKNSPIMMNVKYSGEKPLIPNQVGQTNRSSLMLGLRNMFSKFGLVDDVRNQEVGIDIYVNELSDPNIMGDFHEDVSKIVSHEAGAHVRNQLLPRQGGVDQEHIDYEKSGGSATEIYRKKE